MTTVTRDRARIRDNEETAREGSAAQGTGILGLGGAAVPKSPLDPSASTISIPRTAIANGRSTPIERRRQGPTDRHSGAAGIDMGAGGEGTDVSGR